LLIRDKIFERISAKGKKNVSKLKKKRRDNSAKKRKRRKNSTQVKSCHRIQYQGGGKKKPILASHFARKCTVLIKRGNEGEEKVKKKGHTTVEEGVGEDARPSTRRNTSIVKVRGGRRGGNSEEIHQKAVGCARE